MCIPVGSSKAGRETLSGVLSAGVNRVQCEYSCCLVACIPMWLRATSQTPTLRPDAPPAGAAAMRTNMITEGIVIGLGLLAVLTLAGMYKAWQGVQGELERLVAKDDGERM